MNIGVDATCWWNKRGFGRFSRELLTAMFQLESPHTFHLFIDQEPDEGMRFGNVKLVKVQSRRPTTSAAVAGSNRSPLDMFRLYQAVARTPVDVMFFPAVYSWFPVPLGLPSMVTLHDAIAEHYPKLIFSDWKSRLFWTIKMRLAIWNSNRILTVSKAAKQEIVDYLHIDPGLIDVTSEAPHPKFKMRGDQEAILAARTRAKLPTSCRIIAYVGGLAPHKNLGGLIDGFARALVENPAGLNDVHLALIGDMAGAGFTSNYEQLYRKVQSQPQLKDRVHFTGFVSDEDLINLYCSTSALAMPAFSEGFGLPAVEAMACAVPVLASNCGSLPEVIGDAGIYFDPFDVDSISRAIQELMENKELRNQLSHRAVARAQGFSWPRAAQLTIDYLEGLLHK